ncbi:MAG: bifunctional phosphopantothenoylcysteine decarboxylase/phosphopantothenate--cysteine ligase CoaBC [Bacteroidales bacterium]|jgi:phosphopantothenoylcysteine decarboxylase/phosphopantothenate--cysteine ligase|nr:bifunctional phosphopantothenoylcysteine decarboxylase/phosphopantothenate--cysteine ligase CoaBC [Bacteroidales bacterium]
MLNKKVLIGISGGIAAYKSLTLIRLFRKAGCEVKVIATRHALSFVTPLTIETLSNNKLYADMFDNQAERHTEHISLTEWADVMLAAPATANIIGKLANGIADDALSTTLLAFTKPLYIAPAMNENMYRHFSVQNNLKILRQHACRIIDPESGMLACNTEGVGRMAEPETIFDVIAGDFCLNEKRKRALVTAGPTYEPIDPVRFIGNRSSGLMGFSLAEALAEKGFEVDLITGHTHLETHSRHIHRIDVNTAEEMLNACLKHYEAADVIIMSAAVADYTPKVTHDSKLKKKEQSLSLSLELIPTEDILKTIAAKKKKNQLVVGFALETDNELQHAKEKLHTKRLDFIVLNSLNDKGSGFDVSTNKVTLIDKEDVVSEFPLQSKQQAARDIVRTILKDTVTV